jgi:hypothetical protein
VHASSKGSVDDTRLGDYPRSLHVLLGQMMHIGNISVLNMNTYFYGACHVSPARFSATHMLCLSSNKTNNRMLPTRTIACIFMLASTDVWFSNPLSLEQPICYVCCPMNEASAPLHDKHQRVRVSVYVEDLYSGRCMSIDARVYRTILRFLHYNALL